MASVIVKQKLGLDKFKRLRAQLKAEGVHIVTGCEKTVPAVTQDKVSGKVTDVFDLGKKLDVRMEPAYTGEYHFGQINDVFYLFRKPA
jgi:hypothetical protein